MSFYIFPRRKPHRVLQEWNTLRVPNQSYIFNGRHWFHKHHDRILKLSLDAVPKELLVTALLVQGIS